MRPVRRRPTARVRTLGLLFTALLWVSGCSSAPVSTLPKSSSEWPPFDAADYGPKMAQCLSARGWSAEAGDGAVHAEVPDANAPEFYADYSECESTIGASSELPWDEAFQRRAFALYSSQVLCLESKGVEGPFVESLDEFVAEGPGGVHASQHILSLPIEKFVEIEEDCLS